MFSNMHLIEIEMSGRVKRCWRKCLELKRADDQVKLKLKLSCHNPYPQELDPVATTLRYATQQRRFRLETNPWFCRRINLQTTNSTKPNLNHQTFPLSIFARFPQLSR